MCYKSKHPGTDQFSTQYAPIIKKTSRVVLLSIAIVLGIIFLISMLTHCHCASVPVNMMTSSNGNIFRVTGPLCGEFTGPGDFPIQRPVTRSFGVLFDLRLNKRLSKQP